MYSKEWLSKRFSYFLPCYSYNAIDMWVKNVRQSINISRPQEPAGSSSSNVRQFSKRKRNDSIHTLPVRRFLTENGAKLQRVLQGSTGLYYSVDFITRPPVSRGGFYLALAIG